jgi:hypothetical protein
MERLENKLNEAIKAIGQLADELAKCRVDDNIQNVLASLRRKVLEQENELKSLRNTINLQNVTVREPVVNNTNVLSPVSNVKGSIDDLISEVLKVQTQTTYMM